MPKGVDFSILTKPATTGMVVAGDPFAVQRLNALAVSFSLVKHVLSKPIVPDDS